MDTTMAMDRKGAEEQSQCKSETAHQRMQTFLVNTASSPLFYTVSAAHHQGEKVGSKYYVEQLGCPSILKPSFRDLPGCTRLSIGTPSSTAWRQFPFDKLNKTIMGKSPPATTSSVPKRFSGSRGEKFMSPIKVNAKIRHIYSHITTSSTTSGSVLSHRSSIHSMSTQTDFDQDDHLDSLPQVISEQHKQAAEQAYFDTRKDACTCMSPPPIDTDTLFSVPPAYAGKLEDLEKITGHIVIQRFFTKADQAFGMWLEKQLGRNVKSVGVGEELANYDNIYGGDENEKDVDVTKHIMHDADLSITVSAKKLRESRILEKILEVEDVFCGEELSLAQPFEEENNKNLGRESCSLNDIVKCECFLEYFKRQDDICSKTTITNLSRIEEELVSQCVIVEDKQQPHEIVYLTQGNSKTETRLTKENAPSDILQDSDTLLLPTKEQEHDASFLSTSDRPCIPDVIDVTQFHGQSTKPISIITNIVPLEEVSADVDNDNEDSEDLKTVISMDSSQLESQYKVAEYLGKLEISSSVNETSNSANSLNSELELEGESVQKLRRNVCVEEDTKRSVSVDSCIGTESSGERTVFNDSGILLDSGRMDINIPEEMETDTDTVPKSAELKTQIQEIQSASNAKEEARIFKQMSNNRSIDNDSTNCSRSDQSSAVKQMSDGGDADQSESDSEVCSLRTPLQMGGDDGDEIVEEEEDEMQMNETEVDEPSGILVDDDDGSADEDEPDQFDTIIENHEKEKRLRPIFRKRNVCTQTSKSVDGSSTVVSSSSSRSTTATSESSFDLEFVSTSKKYISHHSHNNPPTVREGHVSKKRSYLPTGSSGLNVLNMKFTLGREFESEVSIRIPPKSPTGSVSSSNSVNYQHIPNVIIPSHSRSQTQTLPQIGTTTTPTNKSVRSSSSFRLVPVHDQELKTLWRDVKSKMDNKVENVGGGESETDLLVTGSRIKLLSSSAEGGGGVSLSTTRHHVHPQDNQDQATTKLPKLTSTHEQERIKRSLKRLRKILDH